MHTTPLSLLQRLSSPQDHEAWQRFVELYTPLMCHWAHRAGLQEADTADLVQDVFALLLRKLPQFVPEPGKSFRSWLRVVVLNRWRESLRKQVASPISPALLDQQFGPDPVADYWEREYAEQLTSRALEIMQAEFEPATWKAFWEVVVSERPPAKVAAELGMSVNAVYLSRCRVLRRLRARLQGLLD